MLAWRRGWAQALTRAAGRRGFVVATVASAAYLPLVVTAKGNATAGHGTWQSLAAAAWEAAFATGLVIGLTVLFRERFNRQGRTAVFLSRHAFAVYLVHPLVLVALGHAFQRLHAPALAKFAVVGAVALPLRWAAAWAVRRLPRADRVLWAPDGTVHPSTSDDVRIRAGGGGAGVASTTGRAVARTGRASGLEVGHPAVRSRQDGRSSTV